MSTIFRFETKRVSLQDAVQEQPLPVSAPTYQALDDWCIKDFRSSAIPDALTRANVETLQGEDALQYLLEDRIAEQQRVTSYITQPVRRLLDAYETIADGIWATKEGVPYAKPIHPRSDPHRPNRRNKYETQPGQRAAPILPTAIVSTLRTTCQVHQLDFEAALKAIVPEGSAILTDASELPRDPFWDWWVSTGKPIILTEGLKSALSPLAHGFPAIALRGITQWHLKGSLELHPEIERMVREGAHFIIALDQDTKPNTQIAVDQQIRKLGQVLEAKGCKVSVAIWNPALGKGIDDVLFNWSYAPSLSGIDTTENLAELLRRSPIKVQRTPSPKRKRGNAKRKPKPALELFQPQTPKSQDTVTLPAAIEAVCPVAVEKLQQLMEGALSLEVYKKEVRILQKLDKLEQLNLTEVPIERDTQGEYLPKLPQLTPAAIHVLNASMNSGKTYRIGQDWVNTALGQGYHILVLSPLNSLGRQTGAEFGLLHIHQQGTTAEEQRAFWVALKDKPGLIMCPNSIGKIPEWFWHKPVLLVIDEANQVTEDISQGNTLKRLYSCVLDKVNQIAKHAIHSGGAIVLSEDGIPDRAIRFWQKIAKTQSVRYFRHLKQGTPWHCTVYSGAVSGFRARLLQQIRQGQPILFVSTSQRECKRLERILTAQGLKANRIDSETNQAGAYNLFFDDPDTWLKLNQPDVLILSPSAKSGVSIEGRVMIEEAYFAQVWAYFPALSTDAQAQLLGRYRPSVPRHLFVPPYIQGNAHESLHSARAIRKRMMRTLKHTAQVFDLNENKDFSELEEAIAEYLIESLEVSGTQKSIAQAALIARLEKAQHIVTMEQLNADKATAQLWKDTQEDIWQEEAQLIAHLEVLATHTVQWAHDILDSMDASWETRLLAHKVLWRDEFPGVLFDDPDECYEALCKDYGATRRGVLLQARAENLEATKQTDKDKAESILTDKVRGIHRLPKNYIKAYIIQHLGVLEMLNGAIWSNTDPRAIAIKQKALQFASDIRYYLRLTIKDTQTPVAILNKLIEHLKLKAVSTNRPGPRDSKRDRIYTVEGEDNPVRLRLLQAARRKLSGGVSTTRIEGDTILQIVDTRAETLANKGVRGHRFKAGDWVTHLKSGVIAMIESARNELHILRDEFGKLFRAPAHELMLASR